MEHALDSPCGTIDRVLEGEGEGRSWIKRGGEGREGLVLNYGAVGRKVGRKIVEIYFFEAFFFFFLTQQRSFGGKKEKRWWNYRSYRFFAWIVRSCGWREIFFFFREAEGSDFEIRFGDWDSWVVNLVVEFKNSGRYDWSDEKEKKKKSGIFFQFDQVRNKFENFVVGWSSLNLL